MQVSLRCGGRPAVRGGEHLLGAQRPVSSTQSVTTASDCRRWRSACWCSRCCSCCECKWWCAVECVTEHAAVKQSLQRARPLPESRVAPGHATAHAQRYACLSHLTFLPMHLHPPHHKTQIETQIGYLATIERILVQARYPNIMKK